MAVAIIPVGPAPDEWANEGGSGECLTLSSPIAWNVEYREVEACGVEFFDYLRAVHGAGDERQGTDKGEKEEEEDEADDDETFRFPKQILTEEEVEDVDYYELLGLGHVAMRADQDLIKRAYRKALLLYHPDKTGRGDQDAVFIAVQKAYETLSDEKKKRAYDSELDFDEDIPSGREKTDFYETYGPVFERNARFAVRRPVPNLGTKDTPIEEVYKFYDYWSRFESWRDFSIKAAEYELEEAGSREEKRWMQKENDKRARVLKKDEYKRLANLVERARGRDPRITQANADAKRRKEEMKQKRVDDQRKREEEAKRQEEEEKAKKEEEERRAKEERDRAKALKEAARKRLRAARIIFRGHCQTSRDKGGDAVLTQEDEDFLIEVLDVEALEGVGTILGGEGKLSIPGVLEVLALVRAEQAKAEEKKRAEEEAAKEAAVERERQMQAQQASKEAASANPWTTEELSTLAKGAVKFPAGTQKRWQMIADFINHTLRLSTYRTKEECIKQYQSVQSAPGKSAVDSKVLPQAKAAGGGEAAGGARVVKVEGVAASEEDAWSQEQQRQLEAGLVKHPASMDKNERWKMIAAGVEGKTKKQCIERYKTLRAALQKKKEEGK